MHKSSAESSQSLIAAVLKVLYGSEFIVFIKNYSRLSHLLQIDLTF